MTTFAVMIADSEVNLWGLSSRERLSRQLKRHDITWAASLAEVPSDKAVLILRGDFLYDDRLIKGLMQNRGVVLTLERRNEGVRAVAAHVDGTLANEAGQLLEDGHHVATAPGLEFKTPTTLASAFEQTLRKIDPPYLLPISAANKGYLEKRLFSGSYKGVTDLVTKWVWPLPARWATHLCVRFGFRPNQVTTASLILAILAGFLFAYGHYGWGLAFAWIMTFLDTVDGKLARVTVNSSPFGNIYDHAIDLIHPPLWYLAWGFGLSAYGSTISWPTMARAIWLIFIFYIIGRMVEGLFKKFLEFSGIFCWRPVDSVFRLITARRNPCLIILHLSLLAGQPGGGLILVAFWTVATSLFLLARMFMGVRDRIKVGYLRSWFLDADPNNPDLSWAEKIFIRRPDSLQS